MFKLKCLRCDNRLSCLVKDKGCLKLKCLVCKREFKKEDFLDHIFKESGIDAKHQKGLDKWKRNAPCVLCGGHLATYGSGGREGWSTSCKVCQFLYDED